MSDYIDVIVKRWKKSSKKVQNFEYWTFESFYVYVDQDAKIWQRVVINSK